MFNPLHAAQTDISQTVVSVPGIGGLLTSTSTLENVVSRPIPDTSIGIGASLIYTRVLQCAVPLTNLTTKMVRNPVPWTEEEEGAFQQLKESLCNSPVLWSPDFSQRFLVQVDASANGLGAVLAQGEEGGQKHPILYLSRKLLPRETRYSTVEKEGLAIKWALESLRYYLLGREFDLETDHRALTWINSMKDRNARVTRWYLSLQPYHFKIRHRPGKDNLMADFLSRLPGSSI